MKLVRLFSALTVLPTFVLLGAGCTQSQVASTPAAPTAQVQVQTWIKPVTMTINGDCAALFKSQKYLATADLGHGFRVDLAPLKTKFGNDFSTGVPVFYKDDQKLNIPAYSIPTFCAENPDWFSLGIVYFAENRMDQDRIYLTLSGGHEGYPSYAWWDGKAWHQIDPWTIVKGVFPDTKPAPFRLDVSVYGDVRLVELGGGGWGDMTYNPDIPDRAKYRMVYNLDPDTLKIISSAQIPRESAE